MGRYCELIGGRGYLVRWPELDPQQKDEAEAEADAMVDQWLDRWDRGGWQGDMVPSEVRRAATKIAEGEYLNREGAQALASPKDSLGESLIAGGVRALKAIVSNGGPIGAGGERLCPIDHRGGDGDLYVEVVR